MTSEEIFARISAHQVEGMMFHEQMSDYYDFLGLDGYRCCHKYHYICETVDRAKVHKFYINHYNRLLKDEHVDAGSIIPNGWASITRFDVDPATKRNAVRSGLQEWHKWEKSTKELYLQMYKALMDISDYDGANMVKSLIESTECEIRHIEHKTLHLTSINFDMSDIFEDQEAVYKCYHSKLLCMDKCMTEGC